MWRVGRTGLRKDGEPGHLPQLKIHQLRLTSYVHNYHFKCLSNPCSGEEKERGTCEVRTSIARFSAEIP